VTTLKAGDEVRVLRSRSRYGPVPPEGGYRGTVTRTGRKYAFAVFEETYTDSADTERQREREICFDMENGHVRADTDGWYVRTPEQLKRAERRKSALFLLSEHGIEIKLGYVNSLTLDQIEALAEVARTFTETTEG
jgi:hypothetical protein